MMPLPTAISTIISDLLPLVRELVAGRYAIGLTGSWAKGTADEHSDIDFYVFAEITLPGLQRKAVVERWPHVQDPSVGGDCDSQWGACITFDYKGYTIESSIRSLGLVEGVLSECMNGVIRTELATWTLLGFHNHCLLSDICITEPLDDPFGVLADWKARIRSYPKALKKAIIGKHLAAARSWPDNFHYISAISRGDVVYTAGIVQQVLHNMILVLFAINEKYYAGEKRILETLCDLERKPAGFIEDAKTLVMPVAADELKAVQARQRQVLKRMVQDVAALVPAE
jgi:hypothetical protein